MLLEMKAGTEEAMRALTLYTAWQLDLAESHADASVRAQAQAQGDLLIPIVKGWCTEFGVELASTGIQVHGGMGFIEETGAAQWLRDVRITAIYEGTTGIQANDLLGRKLARDQGAAMMSLLAQIDQEFADAAGSDAVQVVRGEVHAAVHDLRRSHDVTLLNLGATQPDRAQPVRRAVPDDVWIRAGRLADGAGRETGRADAAQAAHEFNAAKLATARAYVGQLLPRASGYKQIVLNGSECIASVAPALI